MNRIYPILFALAFLSFYSFSQSVEAQRDLSVRPALEIVKDFPKIRDFTMTSDGSEAYFTIQSPLEEVSFIATIRKKNGQWARPQMASFSGKHRDLEPSLSPDGLRLFFVSTRSAGGSAAPPENYDIWYVERANAKAAWSGPKNPGSPVNTIKDEFYPSTATNGNLYFTRESTDIKPDIYFAKWNGRSYEKPVPMGSEINTAADEYNAYVAPDESFLIFGAYQREDGYGSGDLYISFRNNQVWKQAVNMGSRINSAAMDYCPFVDFKSKELYFTSRRSSVSMEAVNSIESFFREASKYENGQSRIYRVLIGNDWINPHE